MAGCCGKTMPLPLLFADLPGFFFLFRRPPTGSDFQGCLSLSSLSLSLSLSSLSLSLSSPFLSPVKCPFFGQPMCHPNTAAHVGHIPFRLLRENSVGRMGWDEEEFVDKLIQKEGKKSSEADGEKSLFPCKRFSEAEKPDSSARYTEGKVKTKGKTLLLQFSFSPFP